MRVPSSGLYIDNPAWPLLQALISYWGITSGPGVATGLTVVCADLVNEPSYVSLQIKMLTGAAAGQVRTILIDAAGTITVDDAFRDNTGVATTITAGTLFVILSSGGGGGGPVPPTGPSQGLSFMGDVTTFIGAGSFASTDLAGFGDFAFLGTYLIYVFRDTGGVAPQGEFRIVTGYAPATGTFTHEAFSANLAVGDKVMLVHISVLFPQIVARGTFTTSSATVPRDNTRGEADNWFNGCMLMPLLGNDAFQPKLIVDWTNVNGIFTIDPNNPFTAVTGNVWYLVLKDSAAFVPAINAAINRTAADVLGGKEDTAVFVPDLVSSAMRYLKGLITGVPLLNLIFNLVNAIFTLKETGGIITTTGVGATIYDIYRNETPLGVFKPKKILLDTSDLAAGDTIVVSVSYRIRALPALYILKDTVTFTNVQAVPLKNIELEPNRYGVEVTFVQTLGVAVDLPYEVFYED